MTGAQSQSQKQTVKEGFLERVLDPIDRYVEGIYSVLIVLTFTLAYRALGTETMIELDMVSTAVAQLFLAALGCAVAWGIIDGIMYVLTSLFERSQQQRLIRSTQRAGSEAEGVAAIAEAMDDMLEPLTSAEEREALYRGFYGKLRDAPLTPTGFKREDFGGALGVALVAVLAALPVTLPLLILQSRPDLAIRVSNIVAFSMLAWMGYRWGKYTGTAPWKPALYLPLVGVLMMVIAIPLGG